MGVGLTTNSSGQVSVDFQVITDGHTADVQALVVRPMVNGGGKRVLGQLYVDIGGAFTGSVTGYSLGTVLATYDIGGSPITVYDAVGTPINVYSLGTALGFIGEPVRVDFEVALNDIAFENQDMYGGTLDPQKRQQLGTRY